MKIITKKYIVLEHQIVKIVLDPNEYLLSDDSGNPNVGLKTQLATFVKNPQLRFIGIEFYINTDVEFTKVRRYGGVIPNPEEFEELLQDMIEYDVLDLRKYL